MESWDSIPDLKKYCYFCPKIECSLEIQKISDPSIVWKMNIINKMV
jgi:hypothetical protein